MSRDNILHKVRTALGRSAGQAVADAPPVRDSQSLRATIAFARSAVEGPGI